MMDGVYVFDIRAIIIIWRSRIVRYVTSDLWLCGRKKRKKNESTLHNRLLTNSKIVCDKKSEPNIKLQLIS